MGPDKFKSCIHHEENISVIFTKEDLKIYYSTIRNKIDIPDSFKLKIANAILDMG